MVSCHVDHIVVTAASLEEGAEFVVQALGVRPQPGGEHERMGTHNLVLRLGMQEMGCSLVRLELFHPEPQRVTALLGLLGLQQSAQVSGLPSLDSPCLVAHISTPHGVRAIGAPKASIEETVSGRLRPPPAAPHVERHGKREVP